MSRHTIELTVCLCVVEAGVDGSLRVPRARTADYDGVGTMDVADAEMH